MNYFIRDFHFKRGLKKTYVIFEFFIGDKWREGKIECDNVSTNLPAITEVIINYIDNYIEKNSNFSKDEVRKMLIVSEQLIKDLGKVTKLYK